MAQIPSIDQPFARVEGGKAFLEVPWFRYFINSNPDGQGTGTGVLHGNAFSAPTWGPVVLTTDVSGVLPFLNGGTGLSAGTSGGVLAFTSATTIASSGALTQYGLVIGGGPGAAPSALAALGTVFQVLHGNGVGAPSWGAVDLVNDVTGTLAVTNGGTGVTTATGTGSVVRANNPIIGGALMGNTQYSGLIDWFVPAVISGYHINGNDTNTVSVTAVATTIMGSDKSCLFIVHDKTSGGMSLGMMDATGGVVIITAGVAGIAFTRSAGVGLQAAVTAGANPRSLSTFTIGVGAA